MISRDGNDPRRMEQRGNPERLKWVLCFSRYKEEAEVGIQVGLCQKEMRCNDEDEIVLVCHSIVEGERKNKKLFKKMSE